MNPVIAEHEKLVRDEENDTSIVKFTGWTTTERISIGGEIDGNATTVRLDSDPEETGSSPGQSVSTVQLKR